MDDNEPGRSPVSGLVCEIGRAAQAIATTDGGHQQTLTDCCPQIMHAAALINPHRDLASGQRGRCQPGGPRALAALSCGSGG